MADSNFNMKTDFRSFNIPEDKDRSEYNTPERRTDIYNRITNDTLFDLPSYRDMASEYGVSKSTISDDINSEIRPFMVNVEFNQKRVKSDVASAMQWALERAKEDGEPDDVRKISKDFVKILQSVGQIEEEPDKLEVEGDLDVSTSLRDSFSKYHGDGDDADSDDTSTDSQQAGGVESQQ